MSPEVYGMVWMKSDDKHAVMMSSEIGVLLSRFRAKMSRTSAAIGGMGQGGRVGYALLASCMANDRNMVHRAAYFSTVLSEFSETIGWVPLSFLGAANHQHARNSENIDIT